MIYALTFAGFFAYLWSMAVSFDIAWVQWVAIPGLILSLFIAQTLHENLVERVSFLEYTCYREERENNDRRN